MIDHEPLPPLPKPYPWPPYTADDQRAFAEYTVEHFRYYMHTAHCGQAWWRSWLLSLMAPLLGVMVIVGIMGDYYGSVWDYRLRRTRVACPRCGAALDVRHRRRVVELIWHPTPSCDLDDPTLFDRVRKSLR